MPEIVGDRRAGNAARAALSHACKAHLDRARATAIAVAVTAVLASRAASAAPTEVGVIVPERSNLQLLALWVAQGAELFAREGIAVRLVVPPGPALAQEAFAGGAAPMAVLPAPMILRLATEKQPFVVVANLLGNDPIDLVMPREAAAARGLGRDRSLAERVRALHGLRIGLAPGPQPRLRALFASQGLDLAREADVVLLPGPQQNAALAQGRVDALYAHTPYLERALLDEDSVIVIDQAGGEVPALANRMIHALVVQRAFARAHPRVVRAMVDAIARAESIARADPSRAADAVLRAVPGTDRAHVARLASIYAPAIPASAIPSADVLAKEIAFTPPNGGAPDVDARALASFVDARFAEGKIGAAPRASRPTARLAVALSMALALALALTAAFGEREKSAGKSAPDTSV